MYAIVGRRTIEGGRLKEFVVEFRWKWPRGAKRAYLVGNFTSWFPGFKRMARVGDEAVARLFLYPGLYGYAFASDADATFSLDEDNPERVELPNLVEPDMSFVGSKLELEPPEDPLEYLVHDEADGAYLHRVGKLLIARLRASRGVEWAAMVVGGRSLEPAAVHDLGKEVVFEFHADLGELGRTVAYYFEVSAKGGERARLGYNGVGRSVQPILVDASRVDGVDRFEWYMGTIYYQIFVDSYENGDPSNDPPVKISRLAPRERGHYGGDLRGIVMRLDHIESLGAEAIYLTPIFKSPSYHRYDVQDYFSVDPYLGTMEDFEELSRALKKRGLRLVLDLPAHHTGACHEHFVDALEKGRGSEFWDWFCFREEAGPAAKDAARLLRSCEPASLREGLGAPAISSAPYETFMGNPLMPKVNHENPKTLDYFAKVAEFWLGRGADGFRLDVAHGIMDEWLREFRARVKWARGDALVMGEVCDFPFLFRGLLDSYMNYWGRAALVLSAVLGRVGAEEAARMLSRSIAEHTYPELFSLYNLLGSHDTKRVLTLAGGDKRVVKMLVALVFTLPGSPAIYYGDEVGLEGGGDPDNRRPMPWDRGVWDLDLLETYRFFARLYKSREELRHGFAEVRGCGGLLVVRRWLRKTIVGIFNVSRSAAPLAGCAGAWREVIASSGVKDSSLEPAGYIIAEAL